MPPLPAPRPRPERYRDCFRPFLGSATPRAGLVARHRSLTASSRIPASSPWARITTLADRLPASSVTHAATSECRTSANRTSPQRGSTCVAHAPRSSCAVAGFTTAALCSSHGAARSPMVVRPADCCTKVPPALLDSMSVRNAFASRIVVKPRFIVDRF